MFSWKSRFWGILRLKSVVLGAVGGVTALFSILKYIFFNDKICLAIRGNFGSTMFLTSISKDPLPLNARDSYEGC